MAHIYDGLCWDSYEEVTYYKRASFWLTCQKAVAIQPNAIFLTRLASHYMEQLQSRASEATGGKSITMGVSPNSMEKGSLSKGTTVFPHSKEPAGKDTINERKTRETEETRKLSESSALVNEMAAFMIHKGVAPSALPPNVYIDTVSDLTAYCLEKLFGATEPKAELFYWNVVQGKVDDSKVTAAERDAMKNFCKYLCDALNGLIKASKSSMEAFYDFEYVWNMAVRTEEVRQALERLLPMESVDDSISQAKIIAWKIGCLCHLSCQAQPTPPNGQKQRYGRRHRLMKSAASIGLLCKLPSLTFAEGGGKDVVTVTPQQVEEEEVDTKGEGEGASVDVFSIETTAGAGEVEEGVLAMGDVVRSGNAKPTEDESAPIKKEAIAEEERLPTKEEEAIAALKMMLDDPVSSSQDSNLVVQSSACYSYKDPVAITLESVNTLQSQFALTKVIDQDMGVDITEKELEDEIVEQTRHLIAILRVPTASFVVDAPLDAIKEQPTLAMRLESLFTSSSDMHPMLSASSIDDAILARLNDPYVAGVKLRKKISSRRPVFRFIDEFRLITEGAECVSNIFYKTSNAMETFHAFKRPAVFCMDCTQDDARISQETQAEVANAIASLTSAGEHVQRSIAAKEHLELNDWCLALNRTIIAKPGPRLTFYFKTSDHATKRRDEMGNVISKGCTAIIVPLLQRVVLKLVVENKQGARFAEGISVSADTGTVKLLDVNNPDKKLCCSLIVLYFHALETILFHETGRLKTSEHSSLLKSASFHRGLLACCFLCVMKAFGDSRELPLSGPNSGLDVMGVIERMDSTPYAFLQVCESFTKALQFGETSSSDAADEVDDSFDRAVQLGEDKAIPQSMVLPNLPAILLRWLNRCENILLDSCIWERSEEGGVMNGISELQATPTFARTMGWPPPILQATLYEEQEDYLDYDDSVHVVPPRVAKQMRMSSTANQRYAEYIVRKLLQRVEGRISMLCHALKIEERSPVATQTLVTFRFLMRHHIELLYDRHVDQLLLCCLYGVCKMIKYEPLVTFSNLIEVYTRVRGKEIGDISCSTIVHEVLLEIGAEGETTMGNAIDFYNQIFIPEMKSHLLNSRSLRTAAEWIRSGGIDDDDFEDDSSSDDDLEGQSFMPVQETNVAIHVRTGTKRPHVTAREEGKISRARIIYSFGDPVRRDLDLANRILLKT